VGAGVLDQDHVQSGVIAQIWVRFSIDPGPTARLAPAARPPAPPRPADARPDRSRSLAAFRPRAHPSRHHLGQHPLTVSILYPSCWGQVLRSRFLPRTKRRRSAEVRSPRPNRLDTADQLSRFTGLAVPASWRDRLVRSSMGHLLLSPVPFVGFACCGPFSRVRAGRRARLAG
jgi:hypothetical protein